VSLVFAALDHQAAFADVVGMSLEEKGRYLDAMLAGAMGADPSRFGEGAARAGAERGREARARFEASQEQKRRAGASSAASRKAKFGSAAPSSANGVPNGVPNDVPNVVPNAVPNDARTAFGTALEHRSRFCSEQREEKREEERTPPLPPQGDEGEVKLGETEAQVIAAWDRIAVPAGFAAAGRWGAGRRRSLRELVASVEAPPSEFLALWVRAVESASVDEWCRSKRIGIDALLDPSIFQRRVDAWRPPRREERIAPPKPPPISPEEGRANKAALLGSLPGGRRAA